MQSRKMNSHHNESEFGDLCFCVTALARNQETIEFEHSMRIDDLFQRLLSAKRQIRGLGWCVTDLSTIVLEQSVQIERLQGEVDRLWSIINSQNKVERESIKENLDPDANEKENDGIRSSS